jgi:hypothetical protein
MARPTALAYAAWVADTLLPNVIPLVPLFWRGWAPGLAYGGSTQT